MHFCQCSDTCILKQMPHHKPFPVSYLEVLYQLGAADRCHFFLFSPLLPPSFAATAVQDTHPLSDTHCIACQSNYGANPAT